MTIVGQIMTKIHLYPADMRRRAPKGGGPVVPWPAFTGHVTVADTCLSAKALRSIYRINRDDVQGRHGRAAARANTIILAVVTSAQFSEEGVTLR